MECRCTLFFEDPFWVAIFERIDESGCAAARFVFGAEPSEAEMYQFALNGYQRLTFTAALPGSTAPVLITNFKRRQREARQQTSGQGGPGTWAQLALQAELERSKNEHRQTSQAGREAREERKFTLKLEKKKQKHRGR